MPKLSDNVLNLLNKQIGFELYNSNLYLAMSSWFNNKNLFGFAAYLLDQSDEERDHALKIRDYILDQSCEVQIDTINSCPSFWPNSVEVFKAIYDQEKQTTSEINNIENVASLENDIATHNFLLWFIEEQIQEERDALALLSKLIMVDNDAGALLALDSELQAEAKSKAK